MPIRTVELDGRLRESWNDDTKTVTFYDDQGTPSAPRAYTPKEEAAAALATVDANRGELRRRAKAYQTATATFLALATPNQAQTLAQVQRNAKAINALLKLLVFDDLTDLNGT